MIGLFFISLLNILDATVTFTLEYLDACEVYCTQN